MLLLRRLIFSAPVRYFIVVVCGFCVDYSIYVALVQTGVSIYLANAVSFSIGAAFTVVLIRTFVYRNNRFRLGTDVILTFLTNGTMFVLGSGVLWVLVEIEMIGPYWAKLITNGVTFVVNYIIRTTLFRRR